MDTDAPTDVYMRSLALDIARGGTVATWARGKDVCPEAAHGWTDLPEFHEFVERCRLDHAGLVVGKIAICAERAIERLVEISENSENPSVALAATKAILERWMDLSIYFVQEQKYFSLNDRMRQLFEHRRLQNPGPMRRAGNSHFPRGQVGPRYE